LWGEILVEEQKSENFNYNTKLSGTEEDFKVCGGDLVDLEKNRIWKRTKGRINNLKI